MLTIDIKGIANKAILTVTGAILMFALAILVHRYTTYKLNGDHEGS
ncbi:MAG: hypothetical protein KZQ78_17320 [Candidatus Thiodiazotropha sp. (ex Ustalcina ferruginea)]|nr:hypothetical protein [Candidatus Thiodiazotropha sp. (ex Ustalcina ferruginea)]